MKAKNFLPLVIVFFLVGAGNAATLTVDSATYDPAPVVPGQYFDLLINIANESDFDAENVVFELGLDYPFSLEPTESAVKEFSGIRAHNAALAKYRVFVASEAVGGSYEVKFNVGDLGKISKTTSYYIDVKGGTPQIELIGTSATKIAPGAERTISITLKNIGRANASDVVVRISPSETSQILPLGATTQYLTLIEAGKQAVVEFTFSASSSAILSTYIVPVAINYSDASGTKDFSTVSSIGLKVSDEPDLDVVVSSVLPRAAPGKTSEISFDIFNIGSGTAKFLVIELQADDVTFSDSKIFIGTLDSDDFDSFKTSATIDANISDHRLPVRVLFNFRNENNEAKTIEKIVYIEMPESGAGEGVSGLVGMASTAIPVGVLIVLVIAVVYFFWFKKRQPAKQK